MKVVKIFFIIVALCQVSIGYAQQGAATPDVDNYTLGKGDNISIQVFDEQDLTLTARIGDSGMINYSYLGDLQVAGKTTVQLEKEITRLLEDGYLVNPSVNVSVVDYRAFYINGEVKEPGSYSYVPGLTLERAIVLAGGLTDRASKRKMYLLPAPDGAGKQQREKKIDMSQEIFPGDVVTIKEGLF